MQITANYSRYAVKAGASIASPYAFLSFYAVSVQTAAVFPLPVVPGSLPSVQCSTAPTVIQSLLQFVPIPVFCTCFRISRCTRLGLRPVSFISVATAGLNRS